MAGPRRRLVRDPAAAPDVRSGRRSVCRDSARNGGDGRLAHAPARWAEVLREAATAVLGHGRRLLCVRRERVDVPAVDRGFGLCLPAHGFWLDAAALWP